MRKSTPAVFVVLMAAALPPLAWGQAAQTAPKPLAHAYPRGSATDVSNSDIETVVKKTAEQAVSDQNIKTMDVGGLYQLEVGVVHRLKQRQAGDQVGSGALEHLQITEIYHVVSGGGTFVTGGTLDNASEVAPDSELAKTLTGRSSRGRLRPGSGQSATSGLATSWFCRRTRRTSSPRSTSRGSSTWSSESIRTTCCQRDYVNDAIKK